MKGRVLVTGASIAGNALAWWLDRSGFRVTVVERAAGFRDGGQNVDVRGRGREVIRQMGLEAAALARGTGEEGTAFVDRKGRVVARFAAGTGGRDGPTAEMEILRGDLARLLHEAAGAEVRFRTGDHVVDVREDGAELVVRFASGAVERHDVLVVAEGVGSATREMVFPGENRPRPMNLTAAYFTIPWIEGDDRTWRWFHASGGRGVTLRPDPYGTVRAALTVQGKAAGEELVDAAEQKRWLRERFRGAGWQAERVLAAMDGTADFYFDVLRQVRMPRWSKGRVVLAGDAAWCVTPLGGRGSSLAIIGASVLAGELARGDAGAPGAAFASYEGVMRPFVERAQRIPLIVPRLFHPRSAAGVTMLHGVLRVASRPAVLRTLGRFSGDSAEPKLPSYGLPGTWRGAPADAGGPG